MGFFVRKDAKNKRTRKAPQKDSGPKEPKRTKLKATEEEISSDDDDAIFNDAKNSRVKEHSDDDFEDVQTKAYRQAKELLEKVKTVEEEVSDDEHDDAIAHRLVKDAQTKLGFLHRKIAEKISIDSTTSYRPHRLSPVELAVSNDSKFIVSCSKDGSVVKYDVESGQKVGTIKYSKNDASNHHGGIKCIALSPDNKYLVTGGEDKTIKIWDLETLRFVRNLGTHRGPVTALAFRQHGALELYSGSTDRSIKAWNLDQMGYVDTMFGHQDGVQQLDMLSKPRVLSCGGQDRSVRLFKIMDESQLVFSSLSNCISIDTVALIDDDHFVSGSADGSLCVWAATRKKPLAIVKDAHGVNSETGEMNWITAVAAAHNTDLVASGSCDGCLRLWQVSPDYKCLKLMQKIELAGFLNSLRFFDNGQKLACAVGQEHRNGRWWKIPEAKNSVVIVNLVQSRSDDE